MLWCLKLSLGLFLLAAGATPLPTTDSGLDARAFYLDTIDNTVPRLLANWNSAVARFPSARATPEDIDDLYHASDAFYWAYLDAVVSSLSYVSNEVFRNQTTASLAVATVFNSTPKVAALLPQFQKPLKAISGFEHQILAQGKPGHWANYQTLDYLAYSSFYIYKYNIRELALGKPSALEHVFREFYDAVEVVRAQYYRNGYGEQPRD